MSWYSNTRLSNLTSFKIFTLIKHSAFLAGELKHLFSSFRTLLILILPFISTCLSEAVSEVAAVRFCGVSTRCPADDTR